MQNISTAFDTSGETIEEFFQKPGISFYIPLYQREYSWDKENIEQLIEDITVGVETLLEDDKAIHFMGTVILLRELNPTANIRPIDKKGLPPTIYNIIDGQQRMSTIALLSCILYQRLYELSNKLPKDEIFDEIKQEVRGKLLTLQEMFSVDIKRGKPSRKPVIVRGSIDSWTFDGDDSNYKSDISSYIASFIRAIHTADNKIIKFPKIPTGHLVGHNLKTLSGGIKEVEKAHEDEQVNFPSARVIINKINQEYIWSYERTEIKQLIDRQESPDVLYSIVQLFAFTHYLLQRCCFTLIEPVSENWAFDMFQSLNATGTPLTSIETFKPLVVNTANTDDGGFKNSTVESYFKKIDNLFSSQSTASAKSKLTNEYLTTFALTWDATPLNRRFSKQRDWLTTKKYSTYKTREQREVFIRQMGHLAIYWQEALKFDPTQQLIITHTESVSTETAKLAPLCVLYLQDAGHKMANTVLSQFYSLVLQDKPNAVIEFISACKAIAAFFTLWRSAQSNSGLDTVYRKWLRGDNTGFPKMCWEGDTSQLTSTNLKRYLRQVLVEQGLETIDDWKKRSMLYLRYDNARVVCKFILFLVSQDTIADENHPGLMKIGKTGSSQNYLDAAMWKSKKFRTIEHIAPKDGKFNWDSDLYQNDDYQRIGNLTLLPTDVNSSVKNARWIDKFIYYSHLAESDPNQIERLAKTADEYEVTLNPKTLELLKNTSYKHHIKPLIELGPDVTWNQELVNQRTERICDIVWNKMQVWLDLPASFSNSKQP